MFSENPDLIQDPEHFYLDTPPSQIPLVLIHDGGGTTFSYYCLGELNRTVYGIHNPYYNTDKTWTGGIPEMAAVYAKFVKTVVPRGPVLLGGWSLGGCLSVEVARILAEDPDIDVLGIVMVDSVCPAAFTSRTAPVQEIEIEWSPATKEETKRAVMTCFGEAGRMLRDWKLPDWDGAGPKFGGRLSKTWKGRPPPVVLLRAMDSVPVPPTANGAVSRVDIARKDPLLGWGSYLQDLVVRDIPGHHFNIFSVEENVDVATEEIKQACNDLESIAKRAKQGS